MGKYIWVFKEYILHFRWIICFLFIYPHFLHFLYNVALHPGTGEFLKLYIYTQHQTPTHTTHTLIHLHTFIHLHPHTHSYIYTHPHTFIHLYTHTHTSTHNTTHKTFLHLTPPPYDTRLTTKRRWKDTSIIVTNTTHTHTHTHTHTRTHTHTDTHWHTRHLYTVRTSLWTHPTYI